jgi:hypothetical protein
LRHRLRSPPRFRALALFGRRPPERVVGIVVPASENLHKNLHKSRHSRCKRRRPAS